MSGTMGHKVERLTLDEVKGLIAEQIGELFDRLDEKSGEPLRGSVWGEPVFYYRGCLLCDNLSECEDINRACAERVGRLMMDE